MIELVGFTIKTIGEVMVGFTAIMVHHRVWKEHKIDTRVFAEMKRERRVGITGLILIVLGYILQVAGAYVLYSPVY
ncbi:hypothetical protein COU87_02260 [Candidatus Roizmanbacteria bacterium CG10_big_fil_rev_8_21_14_0_10_39_12]|uniref:Uncharacterized protein n=1 Tax=Candidatus Roizmanbacteria bacterium CG10_big_fil_rev_8_21_14_0_10_39_12 TaxID=1974852 RepID=A0A2M8KPN5_9BACT|nr:MAG: hypothetical protein COU87_02260 [Candidatus Roizmanbacteria bacterium CG10_big_fil_rev_8_21_14_0_10_39_12]